MIWVLTLISLFYAGATEQTNLKYSQRQPIPEQLNVYISEKRDRPSIHSQIAFLYDGSKTFHDIAADVADQTVASLRELSKQSTLRISLDYFSNDADGSTQSHSPQYCIYRRMPMTNINDVDRLRSRINLFPPLPVSNDAYHGGFKALTMMSQIGRVRGKKCSAHINWDSEMRKYLVLMTDSPGKMREDKCPDASAWPNCEDVQRKAISSDAKFCRDEYSLPSMKDFERVSDNSIHHIYIIYEEKYNAYDWWRDVSAARNDKSEVMLLDDINQLGTKISSAISATYQNPHFYMSDMDNIVRVESTLPLKIFLLLVLVGISLLIMILLYGTISLAVDLVRWKQSFKALRRGSTFGETTFGLDY